jgi:uncharacterized protein YcbX
MRAMDRESGIVESIFRYPVKGLSPERLVRTRLEVGRTIENDRRYAIENGPAGFDPAAPAHLPKTRFVTLMRNARLALLETQFDDLSHTLTVRLGDRELCRGDLRREDGRAAIEDVLARYLADELRGPPRIISAPGHSFSDVPQKVVSLVNLASIAAVERVVGVPLSPLRFRANLYVESWPAWHEFALVGREIAIGSSARARVVARIERCAAIEVNPETGESDAPLLKAMQRALKHLDCGVYCEVTAAGDVRAGDPVVPVGESRPA